MPAQKAAYVYGGAPQVAAAFAAAPRDCFAQLPAMLVMLSIQPHLPSSWQHKGQQEVEIG